MSKQKRAFYSKACKEPTNTKTLPATTDILSVMIIPSHQSFFKSQVKCHHLQKTSLKCLPTSSDSSSKPYFSGL